MVAAQQGLVYPAHVLHARYAARRVVYAVEVRADEHGPLAAEGEEVLDVRAAGFDVPSEAEEVRARFSPAPPPHFTSASNWASVRLRGKSEQSTAAFEWLARTGRGADL